MSSMILAEYWERFLGEGRNGEVYGSRSYDAWHFCDNEEDADELAALVLSGRKRGTASLVMSYEIENDAFPGPGDLSVILNWNGSPQCIIETIHVDRVPFRKVTSEFAAIEGEGDGSLAYWREAHIAAFSREAASHGLGFQEDLDVFCQEFRVIYP